MLAICIVPADNGFKQHDYYVKAGTPKKPTEYNTDYEGFRTTRS